MKQILLLFSLLSLTLNATAKCGQGGLLAFPANQELSQSSMILLEGYWKGKEVIKGLNGKYPVYVQSGDHRVKLEVVETCESKRGLMQAWVRPAEQLQLGKTYSLKVDGLAEEEQHWLQPWSSKDNKRKAIAWTITAATIAKPSWQQLPQLEDTELIFYGCGPAVNAKFKLALADHSSTLVETELYDPETKETQRYYLQVKQGELLSVGHGMCSGAFRYEANQKYQVRFKLTNLKGEKEKNWTNWISFDSPYEIYGAVRK